MQMVKLSAEALPGLALPCVVTEVLTRTVRPRLQHKAVDIKISSMMHRFCTCDRRRIGLACSMQMVMLSGLGLPSVVHRCCPGCSTPEAQLLAWTSKDVMSLSAVAADQVAMSFVEDDEGKPSVKDASLICNSVGLAGRQQLVAASWPLIALASTQCCQSRQQPGRPRTLRRGDQMPGSSICCVRVLCTMNGPAGGASVAF